MKPAIANSRAAFRARRGIGPGVYILRAGLEGGCRIYRDYAALYTVKTADARKHSYNVNPPRSSATRDGGAACCSRFDPCRTNDVRLIERKINE